MFDFWHYDLRPQHISSLLQRFPAAVNSGCEKIKQLDSALFWQDILAQCMGVGCLGLLFIGGYFWLHCSRQAKNKVQ